VVGIWNGWSKVPLPAPVGTTSSREVTRSGPVSVTPLIGGPSEAFRSLVQMGWLLRFTTRTIAPPAA